MSLIKCPECGHEISDKATKCIYCGKELFHCPKCGKTTVRHGNTCPRCGYELPAAPKPAPASVPAPAAKSQAAQAPAAETDLLKSWETACPAEAKRKKALWAMQGLLSMVAFFIGILLLGLHLAGVTFSLDENTISKLGLLERLDYFSDCKNYINDAFTACIVLSCFAVIVRFFVSYWRVVPIARWLKKGTFDTVGYLKTEDLQYFGKNAEGYWAIYYAFAPNGKAMYGVQCFALSLFAGDSIFFCMALREIALDRLESAIAGTQFSITFPWVPFVILGVLLVITLIGLFPGRLCKKFLKSYSLKDEQKS